MKATKKLTSEIKKKITSDWLELFPGFVAHKPMHLFRRVGPIVFGISLEVDRVNECYRPVLYAHDLACPSSNITLGLPVKVRNDYVKVEWHDHKHKIMAEKIKAMAYLPLEGSFSIDDVVRAFLNYLSDYKHSYPVLVYRDLILISTWCGRSDISNSILDLAHGVISAWPPERQAQMGGLDPRISARVGLDPWISEMKALASDREALRATVNAEIARHKLEKIPACDLICC